MEQKDASPREPTLDYKNKCFLGGEIKKVLSYICSKIIVEIKRGFKKYAKSFNEYGNRYIKFYNSW